VAVTRKDPALTALLEQVDAGRMLSACAKIAEEVRLSGSAEEGRAFRRLAERLKALGLRVRLSVRPGYVSWPGAASLEVVGLGALPCITHAMAAPCQGLSAGIVDLGDLPVREIAKAEVRGRIALIDGVANPARVQAAEAAGALGEIFVSGEHRHEMIVSPVWGSPGREDLGRLPRTPAVSIDRLAGEALRRRLREGPATGTLRTEVETRWRPLPLLEAELLPPGRGRDFVLLSGHVDSWHLGAMDNGSANALMLEMAELLAGRREELRRGLRICFWSGHSHGRYAGSARYAEERFLELYERCVVHVNVDSPGGRGATDLRFGIASAELRALAGESVEAECDVPYVGSPPLRAGDESFLGIGVPALFMEVSEQPPGGEGSSGVSAGGGLGWWWHTPEDTLDKLDPAFLARDARVYLRALWRLLTEPVLPFSLGAAAEELARELALRAEQCRGHLNLAPTMLDAERLAARAEALDAERERLSALGADAPREQVGRLNRRIMAFERALGPALYSVSGPFGQDPALAVGLLPGLTGAEELQGLAPGSPEAEHLLVDLRRELNRVALAVREAQRALR